VKKGENEKMIKLGTTFLSDNVRMVKSGRMSWARHIAHFGATYNWKN